MGPRLDDLEHARRIEVATTATSCKETGQVAARGRLAFSAQCTCMGRSCPHGLGLEYKHILKAPDELMLRQAHGEDEVKLLQGPYTERERMPRRKLDTLLLVSLTTLAPWSRFRGTTARVAVLVHTHAVPAHLLVLTCLRVATSSVATRYLPSPPYNAWTGLAYRSAAPSPLAVTLCTCPSLPARSSTYAGAYSVHHFVAVLVIGAHCPASALAVCRARRPSPRSPRCSWSRRAPGPGCSGCAPSRSLPRGPRSWWAP